MRRIALFLGVVAMLLLLATPPVMAAGGGNPPPVAVKIAGPTIQATILFDPHTGGQASINLGNGQSEATFEFLSDFPVSAGCVDVLDPNVFGSPIQRFLFTQQNQKNLTDWVPPFVLQSLFAPTGIVTFPNAPVWPAITTIVSAQCLSPTNWLLMTVKMQLLVPVK
jgi:hypothetical protein